MAAGGSCGSDSAAVANVSLLLDVADVAGRLAVAIICRNELRLLDCFCTLLSVRVTFFSLDRFLLSPVLPDTSLPPRDNERTDTGVLQGGRLRGLSRTEEDGALSAVDALHASTGGLLALAVTADLARVLRSNGDNNEAPDFALRLLPGRARTGLSRFGRGRSAMAFVFSVCA